MVKFSRFQKLLILGAVSLLSLGGYLFISWNIHGLGFPLDDAWIHQVYARNLAASGQWRFSGTETSGGSTSPLWSTLIAAVYLSGVSPIWGTFFLGWLMLWSLGVVGMLLYQRLSVGGHLEGSDLLAGVILILEWHLVWAAGSGMETLLFSLLVMAVILLFLLPDFTAWAAGGALIGLAVWVRPGAVTLVFMPVYSLIVNRGKPWKKTHHATAGLIGFSFLLLLYLWFNKVIAGTAWPNTYFAKQAEYAVLRQNPLAARIARLSLQPITGAGLVLLPGLMLAAFRWVRARRWIFLAGMWWAAGYLLMYSLRLPVTYQHGRYVMPVIPVVVIYGWHGFNSWLDQKGNQGWKFVVSRAWIGILGVILAAFWGLGAQAYGRDVGVIETEMVRTAVWVEEYLDQDAVLGAHDIGALGYHTENRIVDLAGLVSPDVIPFIRDEQMLANYLDAQGVDYLIAFPGWYPDLIDQAHPIYQSGGQFAPRLGSDNLTVYRWKR